MTQETMDHERLKKIIEAVLLAADRPLTVDQILQLFAEDAEVPERDAIKKVLAELEQEAEGRGYELKRVASGYRYQTREDVQPWVSRLWQERPPRYSRALLETLSLVVYRQPITRAEIEDVRGVSVSSSIFKTLLEREWVKIVGHKEVPGKPALYGTTRKFLDYFNLKSLNEMPSLAEITDLDAVDPDMQLDLQPQEAPAPVQLEVIDGGSETRH